VRGSLFEFVDFGTASVISDQIQISIENFEPRVDNLQVEVQPRPDQNAFNVTVIFDIIGQEFPTQEYSFLLEATR
jgi:predicted component of type VI protein secretion system